MVEIFLRSPRIVKFRKLPEMLSVGRNSSPGI